MSQPWPITSRLMSSRLTKRGRMMPLRLIKNGRTKLLRKIKMLRIN